jgi:hypothetical protein
MLGKDLETNETTAIAMEQRSKHSSATIVLMLEMVSSVWFMQSGYKEDNLGD